MAVFYPDSLIGMSIVQARKVNPNIREVVIDGRSIDVTFEDNPSRINVETKDGIIIRIDGYY